MAVTSIKELFRKAIFEVGRPRVLTREFVAVLSDDALANPNNETAIIQALGIDIPYTSGGVVVSYAHPTYTNNKARKITLTEGHDGSPYHVHILVEYGQVYEYEAKSPVNRDPVWEFESTPGEVPALYYYDGSDNGTMYPLTNSAYDYFQGLVTQESMIVARVTKNFADRPDSWIAAQNHVNNAVYIGCPEHTWKVHSVAVTSSIDEAGEAASSYWKAVAELHYRQSGHNFQLPDVGYNFIADGQKRRCMVFDFENNEWIPSPNPVGLDGSGGQTGGAPAILNRRVNPVVDFEGLFGNAPTTPPAIL